LNRSKRVIIDAMIRMRNEIQIPVVTEGAETEDEVSVPRALGRPYAQSYFFGRALVDTDTSSNGNHHVIA
jgi:EAL domain-containing protein (putative c-di-GMP-specific phosphodiesterase class I)